MIGAYTKAPSWAWQGWRLRLPGGPPGGQYHGFIGPDSLGWNGIPGEPGPAPQPAPWDHVWGGLPLKEGQNLSDYVPRGPAELRPRPNASGGINVVSALQTEHTAGYAEAPGNYRGLGVANFPSFCPEIACANPISYGPPPCNTPVCGATSMVLQPPPPAGPGGTMIQAGLIPPISPAPAPTVSATPTATGMQNNPLTAWLSQSTIIPGVENLWIAGGIAAAVAFAVLRGKL